MFSSNLDLALFILAAVQLFIIISVKEIFGDVLKEDGGVSGNDFGVEASLGRFDVGDSSSWEIVRWEDPISDEEESLFLCEWSAFTSSSGKEAHIC